MANTYLSKTLGTPTNNKKWTFSAWVKRTHIESVTTIFSAGASNMDAMSFSAAGIFNFYVNAGNSGRFATNRLFKDATAWYHVFVSVDTTQGTASDRMKLYINGVQETSFAVVSYPSQNYDTKINSSVIHTFGGYSEGSSGEFWTGAMSHINFIDGTQYAVTDFGETDSTTGEWKHKAPSVTYGNNGFLILKDGNTITDSSPNSNNFSLAGGTLTNTNDCPSNNFSTWNLHDRWGGATAGNTDFLVNGNTYFKTTPDSSKAVVRSSIGVSSGKYYCEFKTTEIYRTWIGILNREFFTSSTNNWWTTGLQSGFFWYGNGPSLYSGGSNSGTSNYGGYANNDIVMMALDMDNYGYYLGKNGSWLNSGDPTSGSSRTGSVTEETNFNTTTLSNYGEVFFMAGDSSAAGVAQVQANFGNGYFGTTAVTTNSGNGYAGADGKSTFNYQPPTGYSALSTKGLNL